MNAKKIISLVLCLVLCTALFAGCGGKEPDDDKPAGPSITVNPDDDGGVEIKNPETDENTVYADELIYAVGDFQIYSPLNPAFVASQITILLPMIYDTLLHRLPEGGFGPRLATEWTTEDYQTWHLKLRDDVTFHNGEKFTAQSIVDTIDFVMSSPGAIASSKWMEVDHVDIINDYECDIVLKRVLIDFDAYMADPMLGMFSKKAVEDDPKDGMMVGTGCWKFVEGVSGSHITLAANENYWGEPALAKIFTFKVVMETTAQHIMFKNGELDFVGVQAENLADYQADPNIVVDNYIMSNTGYLAFNLNDPLMADINFRKAVAYAINRQDCTDITHQGNASTWDTASYWGSRTDYKLEIPILEQNLDLAKEYLEQSSYNGEEVKIMAAMPHTISNAQIFQQQLQAIGIKVDVFDTDNATLGASTQWGSTSYQMLVNSGPWTKLGSSCNLFFKEGAMANKAQWKNPRVQELIDQADLTPNGPEREAIYHEIQQICADEIPYIGINNMMMQLGRRANCGGAVLYTDNYHDYSHAYKIVED